MDRRSFLGRRRVEDFDLVRDGVLSSSSSVVVSILGLTGGLASGLDSTQGVSTQGAHTVSTQGGIAYTHC